MLKTVTFFILFASIAWSSNLHEVRVILNDIKRLETQRSLMERDNPKPSRQIKRKLRGINNKIRGHHQNLVNIIAENTVFEEEQVKAQNFDLWTQFQEILKPVVLGLQKISKRPQKIEGLKSKIEDTKVQLSKVQFALNQLSKREEDSKELNREEWAYFKTVKTQLEFMLAAEKNKILLEKLKYERELSQLKKNEEPWLVQARKVIGGFFLKKLWHLLVSLLCFIVLIFSFFKLKKVVFKLNFGPWKKLLSYCYISLCLIFSSVAALFVLYFFNDWFLVTLFLLFISGAIWSLRNLLPHFIQEFKLIMNLGPVREGERLVWQGIPYEVKQLGIRSTLENPSLEGGTFKLPAKNILDQTSRPFSKNEAWFVTEKGDWIEFEDTKRMALVEQQTVEFVTLNYVYGGKTKVPAKDFLKTKFVNLSHDFWLELKMGIDFNQAHLVGLEFLQNLLRKLQESFRKTEFGDHLSKPSLRFSNENTEALCLWFRAKCNPELAPKKYEIQAQIYEKLLIILREERMQLPRKHITVHQQNKEN